MLRHRLNSREERRRINPLTFPNWINTNEGIIRYIAPSDPTAANRQVYNRNVAGVEDSRLFPKAELLPAAGGNIMHISNWGAVNSAVLSNPGGDITILRVANGGAANAAAQQTGLFTAGVRYLITGEMRSDGLRTPKVTVLSGNKSQIGAIDTNWQDVSFENTTVGNPGFQILEIENGAGYVEFRNISLREANPLNASIIGATVAQPFSRGLPYANSYDGLNDYDNIYSTALNTVFDGNLFSISTFFSLSVLTDSLGWVCAIGVGANNQIFVRKLQNNKLNIEYWSGGVRKQFTTVSALVAGQRYMLTVTIDTNPLVDEVKAYLDTTQIGATATGLGVWSGSLLSTGCVLAAQNSTPQNVGNLSISDFILSINHAMSPLEIAEYRRRWGG